MSTERVVVETFHEVVTMTEVAMAALREIGRDDLARRVAFTARDDGPWLLVPVVELSDADYAIMARACLLATPNRGGDVPVAKSAETR